MLVRPHFPTVETREVISSSSHVTLIAPVIERHPSIPEPPQVATLELRKPTPAPVPHIEQPKVAAPKVETRKVEPPKVEHPRTEVPQFASAKPVTAPPKPEPAKEVKTNVFGSEAAETATVSKPAREVQTGGFGDPNGVAGQGDPKRNAVTVARVGSFELPSGPGQGNGTAGSRGVSGVVRSAGFSDGVSSDRGPRGNRTVAASGFREAVAQPDATLPLQRVDKKPDLQPVQIVFKPRPLYTAEARRRKVEGEVLLDVVFEASGALRINRVVKSLGYGLDDNALVAAQRIQFRPARRDGQPYDYAALVHIVFELSE
jgi:TonB family protein